jgi:16S rRNA (guanine966-N2)-methyltransferase
MRIIAGSLRGRRIQGPKPGDLSVRPTSDRAREALFSILQKWPTGAFLDLFGGTGAVALEACSRGYAPVTCVEKSSGAFVMLKANLQEAKAILIRKDVLDLRPDAFPDQSVIFVDPPYEASPAAWQALAPRLRHWVRSDGVLVWETDKRTELPEMAGWTLFDCRQYGAARFHFFEPVER